MRADDFRRGAAWGMPPAALQILAENFQAFQSDADMQRQAMVFEADLDAAPELMVVDDIAVIPISGPITRRKSFFSMLFGGTGINVLELQLAAAMARPEVRGIVFDIDSPGGRIPGVDGFSDLIRTANTIKPVVAFAGGQMASAAYWMGSAAGQVVADKTAEVGSIGVIALHLDVSKAMEKFGERVTVLTAGKYKAIGNPYEPLTEEGRGIIQAELDFIYSIFVDTVARNRGASAETVANEMGEGRLFIGQQAIDSGLVDKLGSIETAMESAHNAAAERRTQGQTLYSFAGAAGATKGGSQMEIKTVNELRAAFPALADEMDAAAQAGNAAAIQAATDAAQAETGRIVALVTAVFGTAAGERFQAIVKSGMTAEQYQLANQNPQPAGNAAALNTLLATGPQNPGAGGGGEGAPQGDFMAMVEDKMKEKKCSRGEAMQMVTQADPNAHREWLKKINQR